MGKSKPGDLHKYRALRAAQARRYRARHPDQAYIQRLRDARGLLEREGFTVTGGNVDIRTNAEKQQETCKNKSEE